jgi:hypothetical protein
VIQKDNEITLYSKGDALAKVRDVFESGLREAIKNGLKNAK